MNCSFDNPFFAEGANMFSHHITAPTATPMRIPSRRGVIGLTEREGLSARTQSADVEHAARSPSFFVIRETLRNSGIEQQELTQGFFVPEAIYVGVENSELQGVQRPPQMASPPVQK